MIRYFLSGVVIAVYLVLFAAIMTLVVLLDFRRKVKH